MNVALAYLSGARALEIERPQPPAGEMFMARIWYGTTVGFISAAGIVPPHLLPFRELDHQGARNQGRMRQQ
jgi:hypothetical protein